MGLRDLVLPSETVELPKAPNGKAVPPLVLRGLGFSDFVRLSTDFGPEVAMVFTKYTSGGNLSEEEAKTAMLALLPQVGDLPGAIIAAASDDYDKDMIRLASRLPLPVQFEALEKVFILTVSSETELKKFVESILRMISGATTLATTMRLPLSADGSTE